MNTACFLSLVPLRSQGAAAHGLHAHTGDGASEEERPSAASLQDARQLRRGHKAAGGRVPAQCSSSWAELPCKIPGTLQPRCYTEAVGAHDSDHITKLLSPTFQTEELTNAAQRKQPSPERRHDKKDPLHFIIFPQTTRQDSAEDPYDSSSSQLNPSQVSKI